MRRVAQILVPTANAPAAKGSGLRLAWRWYPVPAPKTKSHEHRFYPPSSSLSGVAAWQTAAKKKPRSTKKPADAPDLNLQYISSPEAWLYLASLG